MNIGHDHHFGHSNQQISDRGMRNQPRLETAHVEHTPQVAIKPTEMRDDKPVIRYFVSYAHKDRKLKDELLVRLKDQLAIAKEYVSVHSPSLSGLTFLQGTGMEYYSLTP